MLERDFRILGKEGFNRVPLVSEILADLDTPLSVYLKVANTSFSYLLESVHGGERFGRYSYVGLPARTRFCVTGKLCREVVDGAVIWEEKVSNPLNWIRQVQARYKVKMRQGLPRFPGGLVGYFGYETIQYIEQRLDQPDKRDDLATPDILLLLSEELIAVDNLSGKIFIVVYADPREDNSWKDSQARLVAIHEMLEKTVVAPREKEFQLGEPILNFSREKFMNSVEIAKRYISEGDIMQVVISQRMRVPFQAEPLSLYRSLRALNPSPYMFIFNMDDFHIIGSSPEILVRLEDKQVTLRPIAGTRPRGKSSDEDALLEKDLLSDPKELAEHVMLLDLGRNDVGRVSQVGSVSVTDKMIIEKYSHVMHIVSNVQGKLKEDLDAIAVLEASFPAGTVSGAPKVRAMEIINELEPIKRGVYSGAVGYIGFGGDMDVAIAIRTAIIKDKTLHIQAGAGIVADSVASSEWTETQNKAKAILRAAELVSGGESKKINQI